MVLVTMQIQIEVIEKASTEAHTIELKLGNSPSTSKMLDEFGHVCVAPRKMKPGSVFPLYSFSFLWDAEKCSWKMQDPINPRAWQKKSPFPTQASVTGARGT